MDDASISPVGPLTHEQHLARVDAPAPTGPVTGISSSQVVGSTTRTSPASQVNAEASLGIAADHEQLVHPVLHAHDVDVTAEVHDSALHGDRIAGAIERSNPAVPSERAQQLGGAAASAASGQSRPMDLERASEVDEPAPVEHVVATPRIAATPPPPEEPFEPVDEIAG
jgi:hypothetical protein